MHIDNWMTVRIGELAEVIRGASPRPKGDPRYYGGDVPRLMVADVTRDGKYVTPSIDFLTEAGAKLSRPVPAGTLTIVCSGTVGIPSILAVDACIHDGFLALTHVDKDCNLEYLYYFLLRLQAILDTQATHGGIFTNLTTDILRNFEVSLPPLPEQRKIAHILTTLDDVIERTEALIAKYQAIKQGMLHDLLTRGVDAQGHLRPSYDEAPALYKASPLGWIPKEWDSKCLGEVCSLIQDGTHLPPRRVETGPLLLSVQNIMDSKLVHFEQDTKIPWAFYSIMHRKWSIEPGDILLAIVGATIGKVCQVPENFETFTIQRSLCLLRGTPHILSSDYLYYYISYGHFQNAIWSRVNQTAQPGIYLAEIRKLRLALPPSDEQNIIEYRLKALDCVIDKEKRALEKLRTKKLGLMQDLLTGKVHVTVPEPED